MSESNWKERSILIAGCGSIGKRHARVLRSLGLRDIRVCDPSEEQIKSLTDEGSVNKTYTTYEEGLSAKPDAVLIATPPKLHIPMATQSLEAGIHVLSEKPVSDSLEGLDKLAVTIESSGKTYMVALCFRYHEGLTKAKEYIEMGRIGEVVSICCRMSESLPEARPDYKSLFTLKELGAYDLSHEIDLACWYANEPVTEVQAMDGVYGGIGFTAPDLAQLNLRFGEKCIASVYLNFFGTPRTRITELIGTRGTITVEFSSWDQCTVSVYEAEKGNWEREVMATERDHMFRTEDKEFLQAITNNSKTLCPLEEGIKSLKIICTAIADNE